MRLTRSERDKRRVRPVPLLDTSSDDEPLEQLRNRMSYTELLNRLSDIRYHSTVAMFVALAHGTYTLHTFLPMLLTPRLRCVWGCTYSESSVIAISFPLLAFLTPLVNAILAKLPLRSRLIVSFSVCSVFLAAGYACTSITQLAMTRMIAGAFVVPSSVLTKVWSQVVPYSKQQRCVSIIGAGRVLGLLVSALMVLVTLHMDVKWVLVLSSLPMVALAVLSLFIVETPLMLLDRGQYSSIITALEALYGKQALSTVTLADVDFSEVSLRAADNMIYVHNNKTNTRNVITVFIMEVVCGMLMAMILGLFSLLFTANYCKAVTNNGTLCLGTYYNHLSFKMLDNSLRGEDFVGILIAMSGALVGVMINLVPDYVTIQRKLLLAKLTLCAGFIAACLCHMTTTLALLLVFTGYFALTELTSHLHSSLSMSIFTKSSLLAVYTGGLVIGKEVVDNTVTLSFLYPLLSCVVLSAGLMLVSCYVKELQLSEAYPSEIEMEDPLEMELEES